MTSMSILSSAALLLTIVIVLVALFGMLPVPAFSSDATSMQTTILSVLHNLAVLGLFLALIYLFASLLRAFLHEATVLNNRIHSLRLGRLFIYLQFASASAVERPALRERLAAADIDRIFGWNYESSTAFKDIRPELMTKTFIGSLVEAVGKVAARK